MMEVSDFGDVEMNKCDPKRGSNPPFDGDSTVDSQGASLPNREELLVDMGGHPNRRWGLCICLAATLLVMVVTIPLAIVRPVQKNRTVVQVPANSLIGKLDRNKTNERLTEITSVPIPQATIPPDVDLADREEKIKEYLILQGISNRSDLEQNDSPQQMALYFIANQDGLFLNVTNKDKSTPEGYTLVTRYVLTVFYFSTVGAEWAANLNFLKPTSHCDWFGIIQYDDGSIDASGVLCDDTQEVKGIIISEFCSAHFRTTLRFPSSITCLFCFFFYITKAAITWRERSLPSWGHSRHWNTLWLTTTASRAPPFQTSGRNW